MNVLSLFDGMSCGQIACHRAGLPVTNYYASEVDKYAMQVAMKNYLGTVQLGDVTKVSYNVDSLEVQRESGSWLTVDKVKIDLLLGGSPCQGFSFAGKQLNFNDPRSRLFFEYVRILKEIRHGNPDVFFLLENVPMKGEWEKIITEYLGVEPLEINSALLSGQNRKRLYWTNIKGVTQPGDAGITLESVLLDSVPEKYNLSFKEKEYMDREVADGRTHWDFAHHSDTFNTKSACLVANLHKGVPYNVLIDQRGNKCGMWSCDFQKDYDMCSNCNECDNYQGTNAPTSTVRKFTPLECERLQTVPDNYTDCVSNSQRYKMLGNGWTIDVIAHILSYLNV